MGSCCSHIKREDSFDEVERRKSADLGPVHSRRKSSGLSRYSIDGKHVLEDPLRIAAFNVRKFGAKKMKDQSVVDILVKIILQFDIILVQEVLDKTEKSLQSLLEAVNVGVKEAAAGDSQAAANFRLISSPRLGRAEPREQYAFFYRAERVSVVDSAVYPDEEEDTFMREPFVVKFSSDVIAGIDHFVIIAIHTQPKEAFKEIDSLADVHKWAVGRMSSENIVIAGDLNAGGTFVKPSDWAQCRLRGEDYSWLIPDHLDTTATNTLAAYDRIVTCSDSLTSAVVPGSAGVYRFDEELGLDEKTTLQVSDHYPVFFSIKPSVHPTIRRNINAFMAIYVVDKRLPNLDLANLTETFKLAKYKLESSYNSVGALAGVDIRSSKLKSPAEVVSRLCKLRDSVAGLVSYSALATIRYKLNHSLQLRTVEEFYIQISVDVEQKKTHYQVQYKTDIF